MTIIPASRKMTSRSMAAKASCSSSTPSATSIRPAMTAVMVRSGFSMAMRMYAPRKTIPAIQASGITAASRHGRIRA